MKNKQQNRKVNMMLSNGLYVISAKQRIGSPLFVLYLTDFAVNTRVIFDAETLKVLPNKYGVEIAEKDRQALVKALGYEVKKVEVVAANPLPEVFSEYKKVVDVGVKSFDEEVLAF
jgi:hypothetical protein